MVRSPKETPEYIPMSAQEQELYNQYLQSIGPSPLFQQMWGQNVQALGQPGGFSLLSGYMPSRRQLGQYIGGGQRVREAYEKGAKRDVYRGAKAGLRMLGTQMGQQGMLGSTLHGVSGMDIGGRALDQLANIRATGAQLGESIQQGRIGTAMGGLGMMGNLATQQRTQNLMNTQAMAQLALQQQQQQQQQQLQGLGLATMYRQEPMNFQMQQWLPYQKPGGGGFGPAIPAALGALSPWAGLFGGGLGLMGGGSSGGGYYNPVNPNMIPPGAY